MRRAPSLVLIGLVRCYQLLVSPMFGPTCRFYPSCSSYAVGALREHGAVRGSWLTIRRLARCHPWNPGGVDPVPPRKRRGAGPEWAAGSPNTSNTVTAPADHHGHSASTSSTTAA